MSKSNELFKKIKYEKYKEGYLYSGVISLYGNEEDKRICFRDDKTVEVYDFFGGSRNFTMPELKAIYEFCKEQGWLDE